MDFPLYFKNEESMDSVSQMYYPPFIELKRFFSPKYTTEILNQRNELARIKNIFKNNKIVEDKYSVEKASQKISLCARQAVDFYESFNQTSDISKPVPMFYCMEKCAEICIATRQNDSEYLNSWAHGLKIIWNEEIENSIAEVAISDLLNKNNLKINENKDQKNFFYKFVKSINGYDEIFGIELTCDQILKIEITKLYPDCEMPVKSFTLDKKQVSLDYMTIMYMQGYIMSILARYCTNSWEQILAGKTYNSTYITMKPKLLEQFATYTLGVLTGKPQEHWKTAKYG